MWSLNSIILFITINMFGVGSFAIENQGCTCNALNMSLPAYPWHVSVNLIKPINSISGCSAIILNENYLLMASHCNEYFRNDFTQVTFLNEQTNKSKYFDTKVQIERWYPHRAYNFKKNNLYDLSILKLRSSLVFDESSNLKPACLEEVNDNQVKTHLIGSGIYKELNESLTIWKEEMQDVSRNSEKTCSPNLICAKAINECKNELGFALYQTDTSGKIKLVGLKADYIQENQDPCLVVFTRLSEYIGWIKEVVKKICLV